MATPVCTVASLTTGAACYKKFGAEERKSILIYLNVLELAAIGGTNYSAQLGGGGTLITAAMCYRHLDNPTCPPSAFKLVLAYNNAINATASPVSNTDVAAIGTAIACVNDFSPADKAAILLFLECSLGRHANPQ